MYDRTVSKYPLTDHRDTDRDLAVHDAATDITSVANRRVFDAYGNLNSKTNADVDCTFRFTARPMDEGTGWQNNLNRWYDAKVGRWLEEDPLGLEAGDPNTIRSVSNRATSTTDPSGLQSPPSSQQPPLTLGNVGKQLLNDAEKSAHESVRRVIIALANDTRWIYVTDNSDGTVTYARRITDEQGNQTTFVVRQKPKDLTSVEEATITYQGMILGAPGNVNLYYKKDGTLVASVQDKDGAWSVKADSEGVSVTLNSGSDVVPRDGLNIVFGASCLIAMTGQYTASTGADVTFLNDDVKAKLSLRGQYLDAKSSYLAGGIGVSGGGPGWQLELTGSGSIGSRNKPTGQLELKVETTTGRAFNWRKWGSGK